jgi:phage FluMu protein Com
MAEVLSQLYEVQVRGPGGASWRVLVRAVDAESAVGVVRARGHEVVGVRAAAPPVRGGGRIQRIACQKCGYALSRLPEGGAGEVTCPECGWVNVPSPPSDATMRVVRGRRVRGRRLVVVSLLIFGAFVVCALIRYR